MRRTNSIFRRGATALHRPCDVKTISPILRRVFDGDAVSGRETGWATGFVPDLHLEPLVAFRVRHLRALGLGPCWWLASDLFLAWAERARHVVGLVDCSPVNPYLSNPFQTSSSLQESHALPLELLLQLLYPSHRPAEDFQ